jgi:3-hydroxymyristoyl/3-hydroxydecanoyl-(acyl carrier protein) dehydratase
VRVVFDGSEPWFDGHFPGAPILPAVAQLDAVDRVLRGAGLALVGVERARFRRVILPGEVAEVATEPATSEDRRRFAVRVGGTVASDGLVRVGAVRDRVGFDAPEPEPAPSPDVETLIPHRGAMRLIERLLDRGEEIRCLARIDPRHAADGFAPVVLALEAMAQAGAVAGGPVRGWLVSVADAVFEVSGLPAGAPLVVHVRAMPSAPPLALFEGQLEAGGRVLARARLGVMQAATAP